MKRILALVLMLAMIAALGVTSAFAADNGFVDGKFTETPTTTAAPIPPTTCGPNT